jgi:hypothetical protein
VFNHVATKEDLAFAGGEARLDELPDDIAQRPPGASVLDVFRTHDRRDAGRHRGGRTDDDLAVPRIVRVSQERLTILDAPHRLPCHARRR